MCTMTCTTSAHALRWRWDFPRLKATTGVEARGLFTPDQAPMADRFHSLSSFALRSSLSGPRAAHGTYGTISLLTHEAFSRAPLR